MLLLAGGKADPNILRLISAATALAVPFGAALACEDRLSVNAGEPGVWVNGTHHTPESAFVRFNVFGYDQHADVASWWRYHNWHTCLTSGLQGARRLNGSSCQTDKMRNLRLAQECGMPIPQTVVGGIAPFDGIVKPLHGGGHTQYARAGQAAPWELAFFQEYLPGPEYRIYIVGERDWQFSVMSPSLDYRERQDAQLGIVTFLTEEVAKVKALMRRLQLDFAAVDMRQGKDGLCFLEINDGPMFSAFDDLVAMQISSAIVEWLTDPTNPRGGSCSRSLTSVL